MHCSSRLNMLLLSLWFLLISPAPAVAEDEYNNGLQGESLGMDYYVAFGNALTRITPLLQLSISAVESFPVSFQVNTLLGFSYQGTVLPSKTTNVTIPSSFELSKQNSNNTEKGIHVKSDNGRIGLIGYSYNYQSTDGFLALPCNSLGLDMYEYYSVTYHDDREYPSFLIVVGCEDSTVVNYWNITTVLNRMETLYFEDDFDYTGLRITSNKPISVFPGHTCSYVPWDRPFCDQLVEQVPPTALWGSHFLTASYMTRTSGEIYRFITATDSTTVTISCNTERQSEVLTVSAGGWKEFWRDSGSLCSIKSNNPLLVMEYTRGRETDQVSDPFMMMVPSVDEYTNDFLFQSPTNLTNYITILVTPQYYQPEQILVDGVSQENANWAPVHCANGRVCGYCAYVTLEPGDHHVWHSDSCAKISVLMYGFVYKSSYGQPAGISLGRKSYSGIPSNFSYTVLEDDPHSVKFTWCPLPEQEHSGKITHYSIDCTSECGSDEIHVVVNEKELERIVSSFAPATHYLCSISATTTCYGQGPYSDAIHLLTIPNVVKNLTVRYTDDELIVLWTSLNGVISHYIVTIYQEQNVLVQFNVSRQHLLLSKELVGRHETIKVSVSAANDAGTGPPAMTTIFFEQQDLSGTLASAIGGAVAAAIVLLMALVLTPIIVVKMKRGCCKPLSFSLQDNEAYGHTTAANDTPPTKSRIQVTNPIQLNLRYSSTTLPPRNISMAPSGIAEKSSDTDLEEENPYDN